MYGKGAIYGARIHIIKQKQSYTSNTLKILERGDEG